MSDQKTPPAYDSAMLARIQDAAATLETIAGELEGTEMFLALCYAVIDPARGEIRWVNAGQPHCFVLDADGAARVDPGLAPVKDKIVGALYSPIDGSGALDGVVFKNTVELGQVLHDHPSVPKCLVTRLTSYALGRVPFDSEKPWIEALQTGFAADRFRVPALFKKIATSPEFFKAASEN